MVHTGRDGGSTKVPQHSTPRWNEAGLCIGGQKSSFNVEVRVRQGCVLVPVIFNMFLSAVTLLSNKALETTDGVHFQFQLDGNLFNIWSQ